MNVTRFTMANVFRAAGLTALVACVAFFSSCTGELPSNVPSSSIGVVEGYLLEANQPVAARLEFSDIDNPGYDIRMTTFADSTGWYHAELPIGVYSYRITVGNVSAFQTSRDSVTVGRAARRMDLARGRARVEAALPSVFEGREIWLRAAMARYGESYRTVVVDSVAVFDLRMLPVGAFGLRLDVGSRSGDVVVISVGGGVDADTLRVSAGAVALHLSEFRSSYASIAGTVTSSPGFSADGIYVEARSTAGSYYAGADCDADGRYRIDLLQPATVKLHLLHRGIERWFGGDDHATATVYELQPGMHVTDVDLSGGAVRIRFEGPGDLIDNLGRLILRDASGVDTELSYLYTNPLSVELLRPGRYTLRSLGGCAGDPWQPQWFDGAAGSADATPIDVAVGQVRDLTMTLTAGSHIAGALTVQTGSVPPLVYVSIRDADGDEYCGRDVPIWSGRLFLPGLSDGDYQLAIPRNSGLWWYPGTWAQGEAATLAIRDQGAVEGLIWPLPEPFRKVAP